MQPVNAAVFVYDGVLYAFGQQGFAYVRSLMIVGAQRTRDEERTSAQAPHTMS